MRAALIVLAFLAVLYVQEFVDLFVLPDIRLDSNGIQPREVDGLDGVVWAPLLHAGFGHLIANTLPLLVLGWLCMAGGTRQFVAVTAVVWLIGGLSTWLIAPEGYTHLGASGVAFGWLAFLLARGFFNRSAAQILVAVVLFAYWGGMLWGVLPGQQGISWQSHLFGALAGFLAAWLVARGNSRTRGVTARRDTPPGRLGT